MARHGVAWHGWLEGQTRPLPPPCLSPWGRALTPLSLPCRTHWCQCCGEGLKPSSCRCCLGGEESPLGEEQQNRDLYLEEAMEATEEPRHTGAWSPPFPRPQPFPGSPSPHPRLLSSPQSRSPSPAPCPLPVPALEGVLGHGDALLAPGPALGHTERGSPGQHQPSHFVYTSHSQPAGSGAGVKSQRGQASTSPASSPRWEGLVGTRSAAGRAPHGRCSQAGQGGCSSILLAPGLCSSSHSCRALRSC